MRAAIMCALLVASGVTHMAAQCDRTYTGAPNFVVSRVHFSGLDSVAPAEAKNITKAISGQCFGNADELGERIRDILQQHGFFKASVGEPLLDVRQRSRWPAPVDVSAALTLGSKYSLREIKFTGNKAVTNTEALRRVIPIKDGDIFNVEMIRKGIKNLQDVYGQLGYINFTPVPNTDVDDEKKQITVTFDMDEGKPYVVQEIQITAPERVAQRLADACLLQVGDVYNSRLIKLYFDRNRRRMPPDATFQKNVEVSQNNDKATVTIRVNACPATAICRVVAVPARPMRPVLDIRQLGHSNPH